jgi:hypothetical protein
VSSINKIIVADFNKNQINDLLLFGNLFGSEVETPRNDASYGHFLNGKLFGEFESMTASESGLYVKGDVRDAKIIRIGLDKKKAILVAINNDFLKLLKVNL